MNCTFSEIKEEFFTWKTVSTTKLFKKWNTGLYHQKASMKTECTFVMVNEEIRPQSYQLFSRWLGNLSNWKADDFPQVLRLLERAAKGLQDKLPRGREGRIYLIVNSIEELQLLCFSFHQESLPKGESWFCDTRFRNVPSVILSSIIFDKI